MENAAIAGIAALIGACLPILAKFIIDYFDAGKSQDRKELQFRFEDFRKERATITNNLQSQIFDLRQQLLVLQKDNIQYIQENAQLRADLAHLREENERLTRRIAELEQEVSHLRGV